jgi:hypothetical protein
MGSRTPTGGVGARLIAPRGGANVSDCRPTPGPGPYARPLLASLVRAFCGFIKKCQAESPTQGAINQAPTDATLQVILPGKTQPVR